MKRYLCDGIVKGATHQRNGLPCQDSKKIVKISEDIVIIAVADGHGSEKCPRSDRGSTIAVNTFCEVMKNYLQSYGSDENGLSNLITFLNREGDMRFAQDICERILKGHGSAIFRRSGMKKHLNEIFMILG